MRGRISMKVWWMILAAIVALGLCLPMFMHTKEAHRTLQSLWWKGLGTTCSLILAFVGAMLWGGNRWLAVAALALCVIADVMLGLKFYVGMGLFLGGHLCYIAWFLCRQKIGWVQVIAFLALAILGTLLIVHLRPILKGRLLPYSVYAGVLMVMCACGIGCITGGTAGILTAFGAVLFVISDVMVCRETLQSVSRAFDWSAMGIYYAAQLCLGAAALCL